MVHTNRELPVSKPLLFNPRDQTVTSTHSMQKVSIAFKTERVAFGTEEHNSHAVVPQLTCIFGYPQYRSTFEQAKL